MRSPPNSFVHIPLRPAFQLENCPNLVIFARELSFQFSAMQEHLPANDAAETASSKKHTGLEYVSRLNDEFLEQEMILNCEGAYEGMTPQELRDYAAIQATT